MRRTCLPLSALALATACSSDPASTPAPATATTAAVRRDSSPPPLDPNNIVSIAAGSKDHTTLVEALRAANYVTSVANPGPLTVFAPTNDAFAQVPKDTLASLLRPENQAQLREVLKYHVAPSVYEAPALKDGMQLGMANGKKTSFRVADGKTTINGARILASIRASNGVVHVIDKVLLPDASPTR
jgi:uncharacterized surface protein with fasciclin (FAS1) repeats